MRNLLSRRSAIATELRSIHEGANGGALSPEAETRWAALTAEKATLDGTIARQAEVDALDREAPAQPAAEQRAEPSLFIGREQRMADAFRTERRDEPVPSLGQIVVGRLTGREETRAYGSTPDTAGGYFVNETVSASFLDRVRNAAVVIRAGAQTMPIPNGGGLRIVRVDSDPTPAWRAEAATIALSTGTLGAILIQPQSLAARVEISNELLADAPNASQMIDNSLSQALALELDRVALYGSGTSNQPLGLRGMAGVAEEKLGVNDGAAPADYDGILDTMLKVRLANFEPTAIVASPRTYSKLGKLVTGITSDKTKLIAPAEFTALPRLASNQVSVTETQGANNDASTLFVGDWSNLVFAVRQQITIEASRVSDDSFARNMTQVRAIMRADVAVLRPAAFGRLIGIR